MVPLHVLAQTSAEGARDTGAAAGATLPEVTVATQAASEELVARRSASGTKTDTPLEEIPQTINVVTAAQLELTGALDINQALRYTPGFSSYGTDNRSDWYAALRGFTPTQFADGLQLPSTLNLASWRIDPYMIDSMSILRGPTSVLYGAGDPGAIVDVRTKQANGERVREVGIDVGNYARKQLEFDIGDRSSEDGTVSYRLVGVARDGNSLIGPRPDRRIALAPSVRLQPSADTSLTLSATYLQDRGDISSNFLPAQGTVLFNPNGKIAPKLYTGDPDFNYYRKQQWSIGYQLEHHVNSIWTLRQNTRFMRLSLDNASVWGGGFEDGSQTDMTRYAGLFDIGYRRFVIDNQAEAKFDTGAIKHTLLLGFEYSRQTTSDSEWLALAPSLNLYNPVYTPVTRAIFDGPDSYGLSSIQTRMNMFGIYAQDQLKWGRWVVTAGGRWDKARITQSDVVAETSQGQRDHAFSGRLGVSYLGDNGLSPYASYSTSFNPVIGTRIYGGTLAQPTRGRQLEAGMRWQPAGKQLMLNAALYQINQTHVLTPNYGLDPTGSTSVQTGEVRARGIELSATGKVSRNLSVVASYAYQDVKNVKAGDDSLGKWPVDIPRPRQMASLWADWTWHNGPLAGFGVGGGLRYQSSAAGAADNSLTVPGYTLYDASLHYTMDHWRFAFNVSNLFNRGYVSGCQSSSVCIYGNARTAMATAKYTW
ncbi:TonB-dependent siderophore receptor [Comamonas guangdongensis]|uniref:TonB-dependent siderophore receptor n=1 Tax=Comamonas guangdongensis TaxID=510515 RepID=A0ABV4A0L6_9BURK